MIQEKYNKLIYDSADEATKRSYSHLRTNALTILDLSEVEKVLLLGDDSVAITEWLQNQGMRVDTEPEGSYDLIIVMGRLQHTPQELKKLLGSRGSLVFMEGTESLEPGVAGRLFTEAGFGAAVEYELSPNYLYTTEIAVKGEREFASADYMLIFGRLAEGGIRVAGDELLYRKLSNERAPQHCIITDIVLREDKRLVIKRPYTEAAADHIGRVFSCYEKLNTEVFKNPMFCINQSELEDGCIVSQYLTGQPITEAAAEQFIAAVKEIYLNHAESFVSSPEFEQVFGQVELSKAVLAARFVDIDLIFENIIDCNNSWQVIDYEWTFDFLIPINYIFYRAVKFSILPAHLVDIPEAEQAVYQQMEDHFQREYCFAGVHNLHEIDLRIAAQNRTSADFTIASRDYQIAQLQELIEAKDVHIRNIEAINEQLRTIYENTVNTRGYRTLEKLRAFLSIFRGKSTPEDEARRAAKQAAKASRQAAKEEEKRIRENGGIRATVAIHIHLFYEDMLPEFITYLQNITFKYDLYISCRQEADAAAIRGQLKDVKNARTVDVRPVANRGRDLAPLYAEFAPEILKHEYFLHVHTKKSLYSGEEKSQWRKYSMELLLGSAEQISYIMDLFENSNAGLIYPDIHQEVPTIAYSWLKNEAQGRQLLQSFGIEEFPSVFNYPAGSFFWARTEALRPILERGFKTEDFPEEQGQTDGTLAHALERVVPFVSRKQGYDDYILYLDRADTAKNKSLRPFAQYFKLDKELLTMKLGAYDIISFDIFDTLITRTIMNPDDVFAMMGQLIEAKYGVDVDFTKIRKEAEARAQEKYGARTNIDNIYVEVSRDPIIGKYATSIKQLEVDTEFKLCTPRKDMVEVFKNLKNMGKYVILISDMYLTKAQLVAMLRKCGIGGFDDILLSNDYGVRKDDGSMWDMIFSTYMTSGFIHVGDNFCSDIQMLMDRGVATQLVLNSKAMLELSDFAASFDYSNLSVADSLMLGQAFNGGIFNSPLAFREDGSLSFDNLYDFGYTTMGPLLSYFTQRLVEQNKDTNERLLLLSREGYMLEKLIKTYEKSRGLEPVDARYFLTSRRACAVPALENDEDLRELLSQNYEGSLSNLLSERLGLTLHEEDQDVSITYDTPTEEIMKLVEPYKEELFARVAEEKNAYLVYAKDLIADAKEVSVVDVGFSGTIQYFLMKLTGRNIGGHYLCLHNNKPKRIGGTAEAIYEIKNPDKIKDSKLLEYQLFLENALSAPYGQLIRFTMKDGLPVPEYKSDNRVPAQIELLQKGIMDFTSQLAGVYKGMPTGQLANKDMVENIFHDVIAAGTLNEELAAPFAVEDKYSSGGTRRFDVATKTWKVD